MQALVVVGVSNVTLAGGSRKVDLVRCTILFERTEKIKTDVLQIVLMSCDADAHRP